MENESPLDLSRPSTTFGNNSAVETLVLVLGGIGFNVMVWNASIDMARAGKFTEGSGPGGHAIRMVSAKSEPVSFWFTVLIFPALGAAFLIHTIYPAFRKRRTRQRAMMRLERRRNARSFSRLPPTVPR
jgi:hypothetical protein